jgi:hypothetical protein
MGEARGDERDLLFTVEFSLPPRGRGRFDSSRRFLPATCFTVEIDASLRYKEDRQAISTVTGFIIIRTCAYIAFS